MTHIELSISIVPTFRSIQLLGLAVLLSGCGSNSDDEPGPGNNQAPVIPLGEEVAGLTLEGPLSGKRAYKLDNAINIPGCWNDSVTWTGSELFYGMSSASFTRLLAGQGLVRDMACSLPRAQVNDDFFDIYRAMIEDGQWLVSYQNIDPANTEAGVSVSGSTMAYIDYDPSGDWEIFLADRLAEDAWDIPVAYEKNSPCREDNPQLYANGTRMIFESTRLDSQGSACDADSENRTLWFSEKAGSSWSDPVVIPGDPNTGQKNTQPWVDETNGYLYWTADTECACIRRIAWNDDAPAGNYETIITPSVQSLAQGTADGKIVFVGEYSQSRHYAFIACAEATENGDGTDPDLFDGKWEIDIDLCVIPLD